MLKHLIILHNAMLSPHRKADLKPCDKEQEPVRSQAFSTLELLTFGARRLVVGDYPEHCGMLQRVNISVNVC